MEEEKEMGGKGPDPENRTRQKNETAEKNIPGLQPRV